MEHFPQPTWLLNIHLGSDECSGLVVCVCARVHVWVCICVPICCVFISVTCLCVTMPVREIRLTSDLTKKLCSQIRLSAPDEHVFQPLKERSRFTGQGWLYCLIIEKVPGKPATVVLVPFLYILSCCCETCWIKEMYEWHVMSLYVCNSTIERKCVLMTVVLFAHLWCLHASVFPLFVHHNRS